MPRQKHLKLETRRYDDKYRPCITRKRMIIGGTIIAGLVFTIILAGSLSNSGQISEDSGGTSSILDLTPPDPDREPPASKGKLKTFKRSAVCADSTPCVQIGKTMLEKNGTAVDAAIATLICNGIVNMQSMGLGGGFVMTVYKKEKNQAYYLNARDAAPAAAHLHMFDGKPKYASQYDGLSITVPGEVSGYWEAHQRFGKLPWEELFNPSIDLCLQGYNMSKAQYGDLKVNSTIIYKDPTLKEMFVDPTTGQFKKPGALIKPKKLCDTLYLIAHRNASELYNGSLGRTLVEDIRKRGGVITMKDLNEYRAKWEEPSSTKLYGGTKLITAGLPASGPLLSFILNVLDEFHFTPKDLANTNNTIRTYHRLIEIFKYAYGLRTQLGDLELPELLRNLTSKDYARSIRMKITDDRTYTDPSYYGALNTGKTKDHGTSHVSVITENGDAVSVTSSINIYFGSGVVSERTGILLNDGINDFGFPGTKDYFGIPSSESNYIAPRKRPLSSMSPAILVDKNGDVKMALGAAGGTKIPTSIAFVLARTLWMGNTIKQAIDAPRIHHQLFPMEVSYEFGLPRQVVEGLRALGHRTARYRNRGSVVCMLARFNGTVQSYADYRKDGDVSGID